MSSPHTKHEPTHAAETQRILHGKLAWEVLRFGSPLAIAMAANAIFNLVDAYIVARLPQEQAASGIGALGICDQIAGIGTILSYGLSTATATVVSQRMGLGDPNGVRRCGWQSLILTLVLSILFGAVGILGANPIVYSIIGAKGEVAKVAVEYLKVIVGGSFSIFFLLQLTSLMRALGSSKTPLIVLVLGNLLNFVLAILLVYGEGPRPSVFSWSLPLAKALHAPRLEVIGAAWATVIARTIVLIPAFAYLMSRKGHHILKPSIRWLYPLRKELAHIWNIGWPSSAQFVVRASAIVVTNALIAHAFTTHTDQTASTAYGLVFRVEMMALFVSMGWGSAAQTFTGTCLGAHRPRRAGWSGWWATAYNACVMGLLAYSVSLWATPVLRFFNEDPRALEIGREYLSIVAPSYVTFGAAVVLGNAFNGSGNTKLTFKLDVLIVLCVQIPLSIAAVHVLPGNRQALWSAIATANAISAFVYGYVYARSKVFWRKKPTSEHRISRVPHEH